MISEPEKKMLDENIQPKSNVDKKGMVWDVAKYVIATGRQNWFNNYNNDNNSNKSTSFVSFPDSVNDSWARCFAKLFIISQWTKQSNQ